MRCSQALALLAYFGRPACELTDTEVIGWGLLSGELTFGDADGPAPPAGVRRYMNGDYKPG